MSRLQLSCIALGLLAPTAFANTGSGDTAKDLDFTPFQGESITTSFKPGKGLVFDAGDVFKMNLIGGLIFRYEYASLGDNIGGSTPVNTFAVRSARLILAGHVFDKDTRYLFSIEVAHDKNSDEKDGWVDRQFLNSESSMKLRARIGQQKSLFGREFGPNYTKPMGEFTLATRSFAMSRSQGLNMILEDAKGAWRINAGIWNRDIAPGSGFANEDGSNSDNALNYSLGFRWDPSGSVVSGPYKDLMFTTMDIKHTESFRWGVGGGLWFGNANVGNVPAGARVEQMRYNLNFAFKNQGFGGLVEYFGSTQELSGAESVDDMGLTFILNYSFKNGWTLGGQFSMVDNGLGQANNKGIRPIVNPVGTPAGTKYLGEGTTMEYGMFVSRDFHNFGTHRFITELIGQSVDQQTPSQTDNNIIFRTTYVLVF